MLLGGLFFLYDLYIEIEEGNKTEVGIYRCAISNKVPRKDLGQKVYALCKQSQSREPHSRKIKLKGLQFCPSKPFFFNSNF